MNCASCGTEVLPDKAFCHACGAPTSPTCPSCGNDVALGFRFCPDCGASLADPASAGSASDDSASPGAEPVAEIRGRTGERKVVTVLFCDLVGSTSIAERMDPEEYRDLLDEYLDLASRAIYRYDGIINQLAGDGFMALFGAPIAHEDAPARAVQAAIDVRNALERFADGRREQDAVDVRFRIGIHTGPVVVGTMGDDRKMDYTAIGDTTNLAARLQTVATPGAILVSEATRRSLRGRFEVRETGEIRVKGKAASIRAWEILDRGESTAGGRPSREVRELTPIVGREQELALLESAYERASGGLSQIVAIVGEAGTGRSRLVYELRRKLEKTDAIVLEGRCSSLTQRIPYGPFAAMWRAFFGIVAGEDPQESQARIRRTLAPFEVDAARIVPYMCRLLSIPTGDDLDDLTPDEVLHSTFDALTHLVGRLSRQAPVVILFEDVHAADTASRELLGLAVGRLGRVRVMIVATHRPDAAIPVAGAPSYTRLLLRRLDDGDLRAIIRAVAGAELPGDLEEQIIRTSEGVPFFTEEITRSLFEEGYLSPEEDGVRVTRPIAEIRIPGTVEELIGARLDRLSPSAKRVVQVAAVFGRQFGRADLHEIVGDEVVDVDAELALLESHGILHRNALGDPDQYRFGESLTQQVAYESLLLRERRLLHERVASLLESIDGPPNAGRSALLAHHLSLSDKRDRALVALLRSAQDALDLPSYPTAHTSFREAWDLAEKWIAESPDSREAREGARGAAAGLARMSVFYGSADFEEGERAAVRAMELARDAGDSQMVRLMTASRGMIVMTAWGPRFHEGLAYVADAFEDARRNGAAEDSVSIARGLAWGYLLDGSFDRAQETMQWVVASLEERGRHDPPTDLYLGCRWMRDQVRSYCVPIAETLACAEDTYRLAVGASNRTVQAASASVLAGRAFLAARYDVALEWADVAFRIGEAIGSSSATLAGTSLGILANAALGRRASTPRAAEIIESAFGPSGNSLLSVRIVVDALIALGELEAARRIAEISARISGGRFREAICLSARADAAFVLGPAHWDEARELYLGAIRSAREISLESNLSGSLIGLAEVRIAQGMTDEAVPLLREALSIARETGVEHYAGFAERLLDSVGDSLSASA